MAKRASVSRDTISHAERGKHSLQATTLSKIAYALGKAPSELLAEEERLAPKVSASSQPSFNGLLEEERRRTELERSPRNAQLRNFHNQIKGLGSKALAEQLAETKEQYARVFAEWQQATEADAASPAAISLASQVSMLSAFATMLSLRMHIVENPDTSSAFEQQLMELVGDAA